MSAQRSGLFSPRQAWWWMAVLFAIGSTCFLVGPIPAFVDLVGPEADGVVFFVGSLFFTTAATLQLRESVLAGRGQLQEGTSGWRSVWQPHNRDWWSSAVQWVGTLFFNVTTFRGMSDAIDSPTYNQLVWRPDAFGSICFLVSGVIAYMIAAGGLWRRPHGADATIAAVNLFGCVAFGVSALGAYVIPSTHSELDARIANATTSLGALAFLVGALLLIWQRRVAEPAVDPAV